MFCGIPLLLLHFLLLPFCKHCLSDDHMHIESFGQNLLLFIDLTDTFINFFTLGNARFNLFVKLVQIEMFGFLSTIISEHFQSQGLFHCNFLLNHDLFCFDSFP